jgi:hypothetical protein
VFGGSRYLTNQVDKKLLTATAAKAARSSADPAGAAAIATATPAAALQIAENLPAP